MRKEEEPQTKRPTTEEEKWRWSNERPPQLKLITKPFNHMENRGTGKFPFNYSLAITWLFNYTVAL